MELEGFRQSHIRDGAALARYFSWLEEQLNEGVELDESQGSDQLAKFRSYVDFVLSFFGELTTCFSFTCTSASLICSKGYRLRLSRRLDRMEVNSFLSVRALGLFKKKSIT